MVISAGWCTGELFGFDLETTGIDRFTDVPVSYALVKYLDRVVVDRTLGMVDPGREIPVGATAIHGISTARARSEGRPLASVIDLLADALVEASARSVPLVGMNLSYDLTIVDAQCRRLDGRGLATRGWAGPALDALLLDRQVDRYRKGPRRLENLCAHYDIALEAAHDAGADAEAALRVVLALAARYPELAEVSAEDLHRHQIGWHREWAESFSGFCRTAGRPPLEPGEFFWPIAPFGEAVREVA